MKVTTRKTLPSPSGGTKPKGQDDLRCECGNLMALIKKEGIELKCRRCKRKSLIPLNGIAGEVRKLWAERLQSG
ncbi:hypothetical protein JYT87_04070 [Nitrospira defluvii]|nr:hypothetical protein [Nitrospira defluvii]